MALINSLGKSLRRYGDIAKESKYASRGTDILSGLGNRARGVGEGVMASSEKGLLHGLMSKKGMVGLSSVAAVSGFNSGFNSQDVSGAVYDLAFNNPNADEDLTGMNLGARELLAPIPHMPTRLGAVRGGGFTGLTAAVSGGFVNGKMITDMNKRNNQPMVSGLGYGDNNQSYGSMVNNNAGLLGSLYSNRPPAVDGSIVFGQYNSRFGG